MESDKEYYIGVDAGGTSWKIILADKQRQIIARSAIPTLHPQETISALCDWIQAQEKAGYAIGAVGLSCFGPIDRDPDSSDFGTIGNTTKPGWSGINPRVQIEERTGLSCAIDSDVNGALLAEARWGAGRGLSDVAYITIGTGVGGAALVQGRLVGAPYHGEFGHIPALRDSANDSSDDGDFTGSCPFHGDCVEGLASATAVKARWQAEPHDLTDDHPAWHMVSTALTGLCISISYLLAPQRIILGGGMMLRPILLDKIQEKFMSNMAGFGARPEPRVAKQYLCYPELQDDAGALGGLLLAMERKQNLIKNTKQSHAHA